MLVHISVKTKGQGKTFAELGASKPNTWSELKTVIIAKCGLKRSIEGVQAILDQNKQGFKSMRYNTLKIESLVSKMAESEIKEQGKQTKETLTKA